LANPASQSSLIWMNAPDLQVASLLVDRHLGIDVVVSRGGDQSSTAIRASDCYLLSAIDCSICVTSSRLLMRS
jgi:hypothetical protein